MSKYNPWLFHLQVRKYLSDEHHIITIKQSRDHTFYHWGATVELPITHENMREVRFFSFDRFKWIGDINVKIHNLTMIVGDYYFEISFTPNGMMDEACKSRLNEVCVSITKVDPNMTFPEFFKLGADLATPFRAYHKFVNSYKLNALMEKALK